MKTRATLMLCVVAFIGGCATHLTPPAVDEDAVSVFVLDHGRHTTLVVPDDGDGLVRYAYGDWRYYALNETGLWRGFAALAWSTRGTLGRAEVDGPATADNVRRELRVPIANLYEVPVEAEAVEPLREELDGIYEAGAEERVHNLLYDLDFVPHPRRYWGGYNSNHMIRDWLEQLGVETRGWPVWASWRVAEGEGS